MQFPLDKKLPFTLVARIVKFRVKQESDHSLLKGKSSSRVCPNGHHYQKSSDCPTCPVCEKLRKPAIGMLSQLSSPARRAFENKGIRTLKQLSKYTESEIASMHGVGPSVISKLKKALRADGLKFR